MGGSIARDWIAGWNAHDLDRILVHYADDFEMTSPLIVQRIGIESGKLKGKEAVRRYWAKGLASTPQLHFELREVMVGVNAVAIVYDSVTLARTVIERIEFDDQRYAVRAEALHGTARRARHPKPRVHPLPGHGHAAACQRITLACEFLLGGEQVDARLQPFLVRNDLILHGEPPFVLMLAGYCWPTSIDHRGCRAPLRWRAISLSHGFAWKALISTYIGIMPLSGEAPCAAEHNKSCGPPPRTAVSSAMIAKVGAAARCSQLPALSAASASFSSRLPIAGACMAVPPFVRCGVG